LGSDGFCQIDCEAFGSCGIHAAAGGARVPRIRGKTGALFFDHKGPSETDVFEDLSMEVHRIQVDSGA